MRALLLLLATQILKDRRCCVLLSSTKSIILLIILLKWGVGGGSTPSLCPPCFPPLSAVIGRCLIKPRDNLSSKLHRLGGGDLWRSSRTEWICIESFTWHDRAGARSRDVLYLYCTYPAVGTDRRAAACMHAMKDVTPCDSTALC